MKTFLDYFHEAEQHADTPAVGDYFDLELSPFELVESEVVDYTEDGIVIAVNEQVYDIVTAQLTETYDSVHDDVNKATSNDQGDMDEAKYQGREVPLGKPMAGDVKKSKVYVSGPKGNVVKVNFGDKKMKIKKSNPKRRKSFRARHNCSNPGPRHKARYWSCRAW